MKKIFIILFLANPILIYTQNSAAELLGRYNVIADDNNGVSNCPEFLDLVYDINFSNVLNAIDTCFINNIKNMYPWSIQINNDSSMIGCTPCGTATIASVGKLYANDSIHLKVKIFGNNWQYRTFDGFKLYSTTSLNGLSLPENALLISPNPASDVMYIQSTQQNFISITPVLYDLKGAKINTEIESINSHTYKVDVSNLPNGIYFVFVQTNVGYLKKKVVVSR